MKAESQCRKPKAESRKPKAEVGNGGFHLSWIQDCWIPTFGFPLFAFGFSRSRSGVTLLEVLIAIGVASVGLLGVILLIPLADHQLREGTIRERANQVGANGFRQFEIIGADNPNNWLQLTGAAQPLVSLSSTPVALQLMGTPNSGVNTPPLSGQFPLFPAAGGEVRRAFCLDPSFVAVNGGTVAATGEDPRFFPYPDPTVVALQMPRITLPGAALGLLGDGNSNPGVFNLAHADSYFTSDDDLEFRRPTDDRTHPPVQLNSAGTDWLPDATATLAPSERVRNARGRLSWMATIVPQEKVGPNGDEYVLSIIVFHGRDGSYSMTPAADDSANERAVQIHHDSSTGISGFLSSGVGGGEVAILPLTTGLTQDAARLALEVRAGDWVMLSRRNPYFTQTYDANNNPIYADAPHTHRWYRVVSADTDIVQAPNGANYAPAGSWVRFVTLDGPDFAPFDPNEYPAPHNNGINQVTIVKGVAAVFEKTIRLDTSSLWME